MPHPTQPTMAARETAGSSWRLVDHTSNWTDHISPRRLIRQCPHRKLAFNRDRKRCRAWAKTRWAHCSWLRTRDLIFTDGDCMALPNPDQGRETGEEAKAPYLLHRSRRAEP